MIDYDRDTWLGANDREVEGQWLDRNNNSVVVPSWLKWGDQFGIDEDSDCGMGYYYNSHHYWFDKDCTSSFARVCSVEL